MIYRIEHDETRFWLSDRKDLRGGGNVVCEFELGITPPHRRYFSMMCCDPAFPGYGNYVHCMCNLGVNMDGLTTADLDKPVYSKRWSEIAPEVPTADDLASDLYSIEWHINRLLLPENDKLELIKLIWIEFGRLHPLVIDMAAELVPEYDRHEYPKKVGTTGVPEGRNRDTFVREQYLEYDITHSDAVDEDTI